MTSIPCFFIIGTTLAATRFKISLAISSSGPLRGVINLLHKYVSKGKIPYSLIWMTTSIVIAVDTDRHLCLCPSSMLTSKRRSTTRHFQVREGINRHRALTLTPHFGLGVLDDDLVGTLSTMRPWVSPFQGNQVN
jgi:hypothetical protein